MQRLIRFERIDPEFGPMGFYFGYHNTSGLTEEEDKEFDELMLAIYNPEEHLPPYREVAFYFTRHGFRRWKKLIHYLIRCTPFKTIVKRSWKNPQMVAYEDTEQAALLCRPRKFPKRKKQLERLRA